MKKVLLLAVIAGAVGVGVAVSHGHAHAAAPVWVGRQADPEGFGQMTVKNLRPVANGNGSFQFGDSCDPEDGNIKVLAVDGDQLLVRYRSLEAAYGTMCPSRTLFFVSKSDFQQMLPPQPTTDVVDNSTAVQDSQEKAHIRHLLGGQ